jgi:hypothetical protein
VNPGLTTDRRLNDYGRRSSWGARGFNPFPTRFSGLGRLRDLAPFSLFHTATSLSRLLCVFPHFYNQISGLLIRSDVVLRRLLRRQPIVLQK